MDGALCHIGGNHPGRWAEGPVGDSGCAFSAVERSGHLARQGQSLPPWVWLSFLAVWWERVACVCVWTGAFLPPVAVTQPLPA